MDRASSSAGRLTLRALSCAMAVPLLAGCAGPLEALPASSGGAIGTVSRPTEGAALRVLPPAAVPYGTAPIAIIPRTTPARRLTPADRLPLGSFTVNAATQRNEPVLGDLSRAAVLIGDSQSEPTDSWVRRGLEHAGYSVYFAGSGGTGYSVGIPKVHDYANALRLGDWRLPAGRPRLVVVQGGGNDASRNSADSAIANGAITLFAELRRTYPGARIVMVGTLAKSAADGGGRRTEVDALLQRTAAALDVPFVGCGDWISRYGLAGELVDGVHLSPQGKARLAPVFADALAARGLALS
ncbi:SGNH/GDSL hydrolase family protein [Sinomonas sp. ASV486]|uniref:SGNH/GDSL hydrolase family protein n=1 Tax=Sinomonas sp. ASV486 TaxID=3051170 RepID=UPI0027DD37BA|nr:SGNH/GDSL hydrolase family protein [Sinomonas sp. ASV486]